MEDSTIKYCVCAFIDLLGFTAHLEVGADLRTTIGQQAVQRIRNLDKVIEIVEREKVKNPRLYPSHVDIQRINDALILTIDLPPSLYPNIGEKAPYAYNRESNELLQSEISKAGDPAQPADVVQKHAELTKESVRELMLFVGLVSRIHSYIFFIESAAYFPGPKTTIATGYRSSFLSRGKEDFLSANFAFSNAYIAESKLKGSAFYMDETILRLLSVSMQSLTVIRYSLMIPQETVFNPAKAPPTDVANNFNHIMYFPLEWIESRPTRVELFRTEFFFRELNPHLLLLFQLLVELWPYLKGEKTMITNRYFRQTVNILKRNPDFDEIKNKPGTLLLVYPSLEKDIGELLNDFVDSKSDTYFRYSE